MKDKKIIVYFPRLLKNGTEKAILDLIKVVKRNWTIVYSSDENDEDMIREMKKYAKVIKYKDNMSADLIIYSTQYFEYKKYKFKAPVKYQWVHNMPFEARINAINDPEYTKDIDLFICVSKASAEEIEYFNSDFKTMTIHNFIDTMDIVEKSREEITEPFRKEKSITIVSRISAEKGLWRIIYFADKIPDWNIYIIGNSVDKDYEMITKGALKKFKNVKFLGYKDNPYKYMANSDYVMCLSSHEGWNRTLTEARILGVPIITTNFKGVEEQITDGVNGYIFDMDFERDISIINKKIEYDTLNWINEVEKWEKVL